MMTSRTRNDTGRTPRGPRGNCAGRLVRAAGWLSLLALAGPRVLAADEPQVSISGGVDQTNRQFYRWTIVNRYTSPLVSVEFPQYHGDLFTPPDGWSQKWKNKASVGGGEDAPGWVRTAAKGPAQGIQPGGTVTFQLRVSHAGALTRPGSVKVRFADGSEVVLKGVQVPSSQTFFEQNIMVFGMAVLFVIAVVWHLRNRRKSAAAAQAPPGTPHAEG